MNFKSAAALLCIAAAQISTLGSALAADETNKRIVLGDDALMVATRTTRPGTYQIVLENTVVNARYILSAETKVVGIVVPPPLSLPAAAATPCDPIVAQFDHTLQNTAKTEEDVFKARNIALSVAPDNACKSRINERGVLKIPGDFDIDAGEDLVITVIRDQANSFDRREFGSFVFATPRKETGIWLTLYGVNYIDSGDDNFFAKANVVEPVTYTITKEVDRQEREFAPSLYFMWIKERNYSSKYARVLSWNKGDVFGGITAGIGFDFDNPTAFLGYGVGWGYNVLLTAGISMHKETRLSGRYQSGDIVTESLTNEQLSQETYKPRAYVGLAFRFGENPFKHKGTAPAPASTLATN